MNWTHLTNNTQLDEIDRLSEDRTVLIYKHSARCSICRTALARLECRWPAENAPEPFFLDVLRSREVSDAVAARYGVPHESPQVLLIRNRRCEFTRSHLDIVVDDLVA
jgi:bacillithiol system protein YtxJ